ncbi:hypothetical protein KC332_g9058 [Hortaea werneckii]|uniref:SWR1-complex protein 3 domain-containing protein n=2 Tax=Hortaea werneckii TaxID=91943 RepID=A0A3M7IMB4_HORWE|nr:hypothetical protein KC358_g8885 [Hortaea werneckii]KAI6827518.1 hypothetical protein KC350_g8277 [Hortaea werneckii]KAI6901898.1 hypothetical protein KC348_g16297 [Hortaea werneckii]KAI6940921.1 hypothetical protein KC341_g3203 [Hortaea werneckii]KAI6962534.1 hypothetical protein KC329_g16298 [Hortaea werneckii]
MAMSVEPVAGVKRAASGKSSSQQQQSGSGTPAAKKAKLSPAEQSTPTTPAATVNTPAVDKAGASARLPSKILDGKPLPTLPDPQPATLPNSEYQSVAASAVLAISIARSQQRWTGDGIFERYWRKPETGKNARPPPPNNPDPKWMKHKGECRIRIEPHIFECQMYLEEKPRVAPVPPKQYLQPGQQAMYGQQYRQQQPYQPAYAQQQQQTPYGQNRAPPPIQQHHQPPQPARNLPAPPAQTPQRPPSQQPPPPQSRPQQSSPTPQPGQKANPDPVIGRLAARASHNPELKVLMKEVAAGNASAQQLGVFQKHIDELQRQIKEEQDAKDAEEKRKAREAELAKSQAKKEEGGRDERTGERSTGSTPLPPAPRPLQQQQQQPPSQQTNTPQTNAPPAQQPYTPPIQPQQTNPQLPQQSASHPTGPVQQTPKSTLTPTPTIAQRPSPAVPSPSTQQPQPPPPPPPGPPPVILSFSTPNSTEDRFLFPRTAILERLTDNHHLVSFLVTRKGSEVASFSPTNAIGGTPNTASAASAAPAPSSDLTPTTSGPPPSLLYPSFDPEKTYYQPVTLMLEVKFGLETLVQHVRRWLLPEDQAREGMEKVMRECERAPEGCLPLRLPIKSAAGAGALAGLGGEVGIGTPSANVGGSSGKGAMGSTGPGGKEGSSSNTLLSSALKKSKKKGGGSGSAGATAQSTPTAAPASTEGSKKGGGVNSSKVNEAKTGTPKTPAPASASASDPAPAPATVEAEKEQKNGTSTLEGGDKSSKSEGVEEKKDAAASGDVGDKGENARPKRSLRKSVRISEG